jgi:hypothetical protein
LWCCNLTFYTIISMFHIFFMLWINTIWTHMMEIFPFVHIMFFVWDYTRPITFIVHCNFTPTIIHLQYKVCLYIMSEYIMIIFNIYGEYEW